MKQRHRSKEVADGGVSFYLEGFVTHRVIKQTYGTSTAVPFLPFLPDHIARADQVMLSPQGPMLPGGFAALLTKVSTISFAAPNESSHRLQGSRVKDNEEFSETFCRMVPNPRNNNTLRNFSTEIMSYSGPENTIFHWLDVTPGVSFPDFQLLLELTQSLQSALSAYASSMLISRRSKPRDKTMASSRTSSRSSILCSSAVPSSKRRFDGKRT